MGMAAGGATGAAMGTMVGHSHKKEIQGGAIGALTGAAFGGLFGYLNFKQDQKERAELEAKSKNAPPPSLLRPEVRKIWVPDKIEGDRYIKGHDVYIIDRPAVWRSEDDSDGN